MNELQVRSLGRQIGKRRINSAFRTREIVPDSALGLGIVFSNDTEPAPFCLLLEKSYS